MSYGFDIREVPLTIPSAVQAVESLLTANNLRRDDMEVYIGIYDPDDNLVGGGGLDTTHGIIKCVAISQDFRGTGVANALISRLRAEARQRGFGRIVVSTKPEYEPLFRDLAFYPVGRVDEAVLLESSPRGISGYCDMLKSVSKEGRNGVIVMNANPFTRGHLYLIAEAAREVDHLYVLVVEEDRSEFPFALRKSMVEKGTGHIPNVTVLSTGPYSVSTDTFPSYFLKKRDDATDVSIRLDLDIFTRHIAPALGASVRFAGSEPTDALTARYNELMAEILPAKGIEFREITRCTDNGGEPVSASRLRKNLSEGLFTEALADYGSDVSLLLAWMAGEALKKELRLTPKPGLVDKNDTGAHRDMDYQLMVRSINAILPGLAEISAIDRNHPALMPDVEAGIKTEKAMFEATRGVNTHKGAIFAMGLTLYCVNRLILRGESLLAENLSKEITGQAMLLQGGKDTNGENVRRLYKSGGALDNARSGYKQLFESWLPMLRENRDDKFAHHRLLLKIITELDDTNVLHRAGTDGSEWLKVRAAEVLAECNEQTLSQLNSECIERNISPGGAADMLALTLLIDSLLTK